VSTFRGHIDSVTSLGFVEGWAFDQDNPAATVEVAIQVDGELRAWGYALRFREDLMTAGCGLGWCAFRLRLNAPADNVGEGRFELIERRSGAVITSRKDVPLIADGEVPATSIETLTNADPTIINGLWQLRKCESLLMHFIRLHGVETFIDAAYAYVLGRAADHGGRVRYTRCIRQASLSPVGVLEALGDSDEYRSKIRQLAAPKSSAFPFH
jgi:hypothetical protein